MDICSPAGSDGAAEREAKGEARGGRPGNLSLEYEDRDSESGEYAHDDDLHAVDPNQIVPRTVKSQHQQQADARLNESSVETNQEEEDGLDSQGPRRGGGGLRLSGLPEQGDEKRDHDHAEDPLELCTRQTRGHPGADHRAQSDRHEQGPRLRQSRDASPSKTPGGHGTLEEDPDPIRAVGEVTGETQGHEKRDGKHGASARECVE